MKEFPLSHTLLLANQQSKLLPGTLEDEREKEFISVQSSFLSEEKHYTWKVGASSFKIILQDPMRNKVETDKSHTHLQHLFAQEMQHGYALQEKTSVLLRNKRNLSSVFSWI